MAPSPLEIKTKALGRLIKEELLYHEEVKEQEQMISTMKSQNADPYELKKQVEVLEDSRKMIPELKRKIQESLGSLEQFIREYTGDESLEDAKANIATGKKLLN